MKNLVVAFPNIEWNFETRNCVYQGCGDYPVFEVMGVHKHDPHVTVKYRWAHPGGAVARLWVYRNGVEEMYYAPASFKQVKQHDIMGFIDLCVG